MASRHPIIAATQSLLADLSAHTFPVHLCWVPGHAGVTGEVVGILARSAALPSPKLLLSTAPVPRRVSMHILQRWLLSEWETRWRSSRPSRGSTLSSGFPTIASAAALQALVLSGASYELLQLTSHSTLQRYLSGAPDQPFCPLCQVLWSCRHIIFECPRFAEPKQALITASQGTWSRNMPLVVLTQDFQQIFFLQEFAVQAMA